MNATVERRDLGHGLIAISVGRRWAAVIDYDAIAISAGRLSGASGHRSGCWCADRVGGWGVGRTPERAVLECAKPMTYSSLRQLKAEMDFDLAVA